MDKRPLGIMGAVFFITVTLLSKLGFDKALYALSAFLVAVFFILLKQRKIAFFSLIMSSVLCASCIFYVQDTNFRTYEEYFSGNEMYVEGVICETNYYDKGNNYFIIKTNKINSGNVSIKIRVSGVEKTDRHRLYDKITLKANLYPADKLELFGETYCRPKNIPLIGSCISDTVRITENENKPIMYYILSYRHRLFESVVDMIPNDIGGFIVGITIGEKDLMSKALTEKFNITGTSHILVVSGMHVAILSGFLYWILKRILGNRISSVLSILFIVVFMAFTGFTPSVIRSGCMMILSIGARMFNEKQDSLNTLGLSALVLTAIQPFSVYNVGTLFSYASVFGILLMNEYVMPRLNLMAEKIKFVPIRKALLYSSTLVLLTLSAQIFTFPISVLYNIEFSFISVAANFLISFLSDFVMVVGGIGVVLLSAFPFFGLTKFALGLAILASKLVIAIIYKVAELDEFYVSVTNLRNYIFVALVTLFIFLLVLSNVPSKKKAAVFSLFIAPLFLLSTLIESVYKASIVEFNVLDVGYGMCITINHSGETIMLACGGEDADDISDNLEYLQTDNIKAMYLPVDNNANLVSNAFIIGRRHNVERVITSSEYKFSMCADNVTSADYVRATYWQGKVVIDYYTKKNCSFAVVRIDDECILVNFYGNIKDEYLDEDCKTPDVYVTMYQNTYKTDFTEIKEYVVSNSYEVSVPSTTNNVHVTYNDSSYKKLFIV